jgi:hypothetical protein
MWLAVEPTGSSTRGARWDHLIGAWWSAHFVEDGYEGSLNRTRITERKVYSALIQETTHFQPCRFEFGEGMMISDPIFQEFWCNTLLYQDPLMYHLRKDPVGIRRRWQVVMMEVSVRLLGTLIHFRPEGYFVPEV